MARLDDGFPTTITLAGASSLVFQEKEVTPIAISGGGATEVSTMRNTAWKTRSPKKLKTATEMTVVVAYDPALYNTIIAQINVSQAISIHFPDGTTVTFTGWLNEFKPGKIVEGEQPTAEITFLSQGSLS